MSEPKTFYEKRRRLGRELVLARQLGVPWKQLEKTYGCGRQWLHELYAAELRRIRRRDRSKLEDVALHLGGFPAVRYQP